MDFIWGLITGITFWPLIIFLLECAVLLACINVGNGGAALVSAAVVAALYQFLFNIDILGYIQDNPLWVVVGAALYVAAGVGTSLFLWGSYVKKWRLKYNEMEEGYDKRAMHDDKPVAKNRKNLIIGWMTFWPWSLLWWILADFVLEIFSTIYRNISKWYDAITDRHLKDLPAPKTEDEIANARPFGGLAQR